MCTKHTTMFVSSTHLVNHLIIYIYIYTQKHDIINIQHEKETNHRHILDKYTYNYINRIYIVSLCISLRYSIRFYRDIPNAKPLICRTQHTKPRTRSSRTNIGIYVNIGDFANFDRDYCTPYFTCCVVFLSR